MSRFLSPLKMKPAMKPNVAMTVDWRHLILLGLGVRDPSRRQLILPPIDWRTRRPATLRHLLRRDTVRVQLRSYDYPSLPVSGLLTTWLHPCWNSTMSDGFTRTSRPSKLPFFTPNRCLFRRPCRTGSLLAFCTVDWMTKARTPRVR